MKMCVLVIGLFILCFVPRNTNAQSFEVQQLLLNVEKLAQLKQILSDLKKGYEIVSTGYNTIKNISEGNFNLHQVFLDGLLQVSPTVRKYKRISDIINDQLQLVKEYKQAYNRFHNDKNFSTEEIEYIGKVYANLFQQSLSSLDALAMVITANKLRMSDEERLKAIDGIYKDVKEKLLFLRHFNNSTKILSLQREKERIDVETTQIIHGLTR